jgi:integrase
MTISEYVSVALANVPQHEEKVAQTYKRIASFVRFLGRDPRIEEVNQQLVDGWLADLKLRGLSWDTIRNYRSRVLFVWNHAYEHNRNDRVPPTRWRPRKEPKRPKDERVQSELLRPARTPSERRDKQLVGMPLLEYIQQYIQSRDITPDYADKITYCNRKFCEWLGYDPGIGGLDAPLVNEFLAHLLSIGKRPDTVAGYRRALACVWNQAYIDRDTDQEPHRLRKVKFDREPIEAYSHTEIRKLLEVAAALPGYFPNGVRRSDFWQTAILSAYSTGLRRGDLLRVRISQIDQRGTAVVIQNKTGYRVCVRFCREAMELICKMHVDDERALPWPYHENALSRQFRALKKAAGIKRGQFRWIRRSAGSYAERYHPGAGSKLLGHRNSQVFNRHYNDELISVAKPIEPPPIKSSAKRAGMSETD